MSDRMSRGALTGGWSRAAIVGTAAGVSVPRLRAAEPGRTLKIGLIGSGARGTGAALDAMNADPNVRVVALADLFPDRIARCREQLLARTSIEDKHCFVGLDAFSKVLELDVDYVILATPPHFRPDHLEAAVQAGKHVFMEKPAAVDPVGIRKVLAAGEKAAGKGLAIVAGTQRRHHKGYIETVRRIHDGAIGRILAAQCYWNQEGPRNEARFLENRTGRSDFEWMVRGWYRWRWLSGDHIVEQHVHNIDVINWVLGTHPTRVVAMGSRHRRLSGDQYDWFAADFVYPGDKTHQEIRVLSQCRQITGCAKDISERVIGETGVSNCNGWISTVGKLDVKSPPEYVQEHADLIAAIRAGKPINEARNIAESTLCGIMARMSAYTGKAVTWDQAIKSDEKLSPPDVKLTPENLKSLIPVPGAEAGPPRGGRAPAAARKKGGAS